MRARILSWALFAGLASAACAANETWVSVPPVEAPTALVSVVLGPTTRVHALDLRSSGPLRIEGVEDDALIEASIFEAELAELGLAEGEQRPSELPRPLRLKDGDRFRKLSLEAEPPRWLEATAPSPSVADFPLPAERPADPCPSFEIELVILEEPGLIHSMTRGADDTLLVFGSEVLGFEGEQTLIGEPRAYSLRLDGSFERFRPSPSVGLEAALLDGDRGYWEGNDGQVYWGVQRGARVELEPFGSRVQPSIHRLVGAPTSSTSLYVLTDDIPNPQVDAPAIYRFDGRDWAFLVDVPSDATMSMSFGEGEAVVVSNGQTEALHISGDTVTGRALPDVATVVRYLTDFGFVAGERGSFMRYRREQGRWEAFARPAQQTTRVRGLAGYRGGFIAVYETAVTFYSPHLDAFCPIIDLPWPDLTWIEVIGNDVVVAPTSDRDSTSMRVFLLRHQDGGF